MNMEPWHYDTAEDLDKTLVERLRDFPREPDLLVYSAPAVGGNADPRLAAGLSPLAGLRRREPASRRVVRAGGQPLQPSGCLDDPLGDAHPQVAPRVPRRRPGFLLRQHSTVDHRRRGGQRLAFQSPGEHPPEPFALQTIAGEPGQRPALFPEGTRSTTGELGEFKPGIGLMLAGTRVPIVPCWLDGTFRAWPKGSCFPRPRRVRLAIGKPRTYEHLGRGKDSALEISRDLREAILEFGFRRFRQARNPFMTEHLIFKPTPLA